MDFLFLPPSPPLAILVYIGLSYLSTIFPMVLGIIFISSLVNDQFVFSSTNSKPTSVTQRGLSV